MVKEIKRKKMINPFHYHIGARYRTEVIIRYLFRKVKSDNVVADLGCGLAYMTYMISKRCKCIGIDIEESVLKEAKRINPSKRIFYVAGNSFHLPIKDSTIDHAICSELIEHLKEPTKLIKETRRILKKNGLFIVTSPSTEGLIKVSDKCHKHGTEKHYKEGYSKKELGKLLEKNGFKVLKFRYCMVFFTQIAMEITKLIYSLKNKKYSKQDQLVKENKSLLFYLNKKLFFLLLLLKEIDKLLEKYLKGSIIIVVAKKDT